MTTEEDPPKQLLLILLLLPLLILTKEEVKEDIVAKIVKEPVEIQQLAVIGNNTLLPIVTPFCPTVYTLGSLVRVYALGDLTEEETELMDKIMDCESNDNSIARNPKSSAYGRCQMIESTRRHCEEKWGLEIDWENPEHQGYACERLLREEGCSHWQETANCHKCY